MKRWIMWISCGLMPCPVVEARGQDKTRIFTLPSAHIETEP